MDMTDICRANLVLATDSYKLSHHSQYPEGTQRVYSYLESRPGADHPYTVFFGLQYILERYLTGRRVTARDVDEAQLLANAHLPDGKVFNYEGWMHVVNEHDGQLPLRIKAVPEGTVVPTGNVLLTCENTCDECWWLTNAMESLLTHVWYPTTVATLSRNTLGMIGDYLSHTAMSMEGLPFMLHDFGYRGASSHESAAIGGAAHLVNGLGTDTLPAMLLARDYYGASLDGLAYSVPATEHSVMTALGRDGERDQVARVLAENPTGIVSIVADSYDIYRFVHMLGTTFHDQIMARDGKVVVRPDSTTPEHQPPQQMVWIMNQLYGDFGGMSNAKGYRILDKHVGVLWGDGLNPQGIQQILEAVEFNSFSVESLVFGMGGGLLQKVNRDTERFAFKASAMQRNGQWHDVSKEPLDASKASKAGRLALVPTLSGSLTTVREDDRQLVTPEIRDVLQTVFLNGALTVRQSFDEIRERASLESRNLALA